MRSQRGLTLLETLIASFLLLFILLSMVTAYTFGRLSLEREEVKRKATAVCQNRLETVKARYARQRPQIGDAAWANIIPSQIDTTVVVDRQTFTVASTVAVDNQADQKLKVVTIIVSWTAKRNNNTSLTRSVRGTTSIGKIIGAPISS